MRGNSWPRRLPTTPGSWGLTMRVVQDAPPSTDTDTPASRLATTITDSVRSRVPAPARPSPARPAPHSLAPTASCSPPLLFARAAAFSMPDCVGVRAGLHRIRPPSSVPARSAVSSPFPTNARLNTGPSSVATRVQVSPVSIESARPACPTAMMTALFRYREAIDVMLRASSDRTRCQRWPLRLSGTGRLARSDEGEASSATAVRLPPPR